MLLPTTLSFVWLTSSPERPVKSVLVSAILPSPCVRLVARASVANYSRGTPRRASRTNRLRLLRHPSRLRRPETCSRKTCSAGLRSCARRATRGRRCPGRRRPTDRRDLAELQRLTAVQFEVDVVVFHAHGVHQPADRVGLIVQALHHLADQVAGGAQAVLKDEPFEAVLQGGGRLELTDLAHLRQQLVVLCRLQR